MLMNKIDLVVLAGGKGSRVKNYIKNIPKPLYRYNNVSFLQILLNYYCKYPFQNVYILCGYKGKKIFDQFNNKIINFVKIKCIIETSPLGTAGALRGFKESHKKRFFFNKWR
jgi:D-glycero-alpha-D-manno-heptose 1-phosphate guanylyltransferase